MENNEILTNEEVMETTEEIVNASSGKGFKVAAGIGLAVLAGVTLPGNVIFKLVGFLFAFFNRYARLLFAFFSDTA